MHFPLEDDFLEFAELYVCWRWLLELKQQIKDESPPNKKFFLF
jgi:hypothetical protein